MFRFRKDSRLISFFTDVLAIVLGLTLSFMLDGWRVEQKRLEEEVAILQAIQQDLTADANFANRIRNATTLKIQAKRALLDPDTRAKFVPDSLRSHVNSLAGYLGFMGNNHTYESIAAEARTRISDPELRKGLQDYYSFTYGVTNDWAEYDKRLSVERLQFMRQHLQTDGVQTAFVNSTLEQDGFQRRSIIEFNIDALERIFQESKFVSHIHWSIQADDLTIGFINSRLETIRTLQNLLKMHLNKIN